jgi:APA family basic amino acid/polyamine antiporter
LHGWRPRFGAGFQNTFVVLKLALLMAFLGLALFQMGGERGTGAPLESGPATVWAMTTAFANALVWISLSYSGFNAAVYVAGEAEAPRDLVPKSLLLGTSLVTLLYVLLNAVFVYAPPAETVAGQADVAAVAAEWLGGKGLANLVRAIICLALLTSVSSMMMAAPRVYAKMAEDGLLPKLLRFTGEAPRVAIALQVALASGIVLVSSLQDLLSYLGLTLSLSAACSVACLLLPRQREKPLLHRVHFIPVFYILATLIAGFLMALRSPMQVAATALTFALGAVVYGLTAASGRSLRSPSRR